MKKLSIVFGLLAIILSNVMCAVVAFNYRDMLCGIQHSCYSSPAWVAFLSAIPYARAIAVCVIFAVVFKRRSASQN